MASREHEVKPLTGGRRRYCNLVSRGCGAPAAYWVSWSQGNMSGHGRARFLYWACEEHASRFAKRHGLTLEKKP